MQISVPIRAKVVAKQMNAYVSSIRNGQQLAAMLSRGVGQTRSGAVKFAAKSGFRAFAWPRNSESGRRRTPDIFRVARSRRKTDAVLTVPGQKFASMQPHS